MSIKISALGSATNIAALDLIQIVDVNDTSMAGTGTNKKATAQVVGNNLPVVATGSTMSRSLKDRFADIVNVKDFGAVGDGVTDDTAAFQAAFLYLTSKGGGTLKFSNKHLIDQNLIVPRNVTVCGPTGRCDPGNSFSTSSYSEMYGALQNVAKLILNPNISITHLGSGGFDKVYFTRKGLALDGTDLATSYSGTALLATNTDSLFVTDCSFLGFHRASSLSNTARTVWTGVFIDCNNGIKQENSFDQSKFDQIHCYNFLVWGITGNDDPRTLRSGIAFQFTGNFNGGPTLNDCFEYGFLEGFHFSCAGSYKLIGCWSDGPQDGNGPLNQNSVGLFIRSQSITPAQFNAELQIIGFTCSSKGTGIAVGTPSIPDMYGAIVVNTAHLFYCNVGINCYAQKLVLDNVAIRSYRQIALLFNSKIAADTAFLSNLHFYDPFQSASCEINCGAGDPLRTNVVALGRGRYLNCVPYSAIRDNTGLVLIEDSRTQINITSVNGTSGQIGDIQPKVAGRVITLTFINNGFSINNDNNFKLVGGVSISGNSGTSITLKRDNGNTQWVEQSRSVF